MRGDEFDGIYAQGSGEGAAFSTPLCVITNPLLLRNFHSLGPYPCEREYVFSMKCNVDCMQAVVCGGCHGTQLLCSRGWPGSGRVRADPGSDRDCRDRHSDLAGWQGE